jgi:ribosome recycling factor
LKDIKKAKENKEISEDDEKSFEKDLQKVIDEANKTIDEKFKKKTDDIMKI